jgi:carbamate kinase
MANPQLNYNPNQQVGADIFMILTEIEAERYIAEGHFAPGSMLSKVRRQ